MWNDVIFFFFLDSNDVNVLNGHLNPNPPKPKLTCYMLQIPMHKSIR